jgi:hypothetical protein
LKAQAREEKIVAKGQREIEIGLMKVTQLMKDPISKNS